MSQEPNLLVQANEIVSQCDRCGTCLTVCPLFGAKNIEASAARGKNNLTRALYQGLLQPSDELEKSVNFCLLCRTCVDSCPNKVQTDEAMMFVRQYLADRSGGAAVKYKAIGQMMKNRSLVKLSATALTVLRKTNLQALVPFGMAPKEFSREKYMAAFAGPAVLKKTPIQKKPIITKNAKVAYFLGCGMKMMFPEAVKETKTLLQSLTKPQFVDNVCCGIPHLAHGLREDFLNLAKKNISLYEDADIVVSDCASCSSTLKQVAAHFTNDPLWQAKAQAFSEKIMDLTEYLVKAGYQPRQTTTAKVTFHEPCHLVRGQKLRTEPRALLQAAADYVEMKGSDSCCGGAGTFHMDYPDISDSLLDKKRQNIEDSAAQIVVTECPTCLVQMNKAAQKSGGKFKVMHISQIL
ncbi:MAG: (Fe-S)-binding protein [Sporomusaceae bacterium]|nr:(Fe-S)-binding protein [Sporomusaceae bacterium]